MHIVVTGSSGFIGANLLSHLHKSARYSVTCCGHDDVLNLPSTVANADVIFHLAGVNRPTNQSEYFDGNAGFTKALCDAVRAGRGRPTIIYASSIQADIDNPYGRSKALAERELMTLAEMQGIDLRIYRLPNVFGKWSRPNYNSAIATFCHNVARNLPLTIHDPRARLRLVYIDDVIDTWLNGLAELSSQSRVFHEIHPVYESTVGEVAEVIEGFRNARATLMPGEVGSGFMRALYATYLSFVPPEDFAYSLTRHEDHRGVFVEMLRTQSAGQFSFFTAHPGITRGGHYHHTKSEKFLVIQGTARFRFRHVVSGEESTLEVRGEQSRVVETVPGWSHDITNIGDTELIVMLWANERFDRDKPDTVAMPL